MGTAHEHNVRRSMASMYQVVPKEQQACCSISLVLSVLLAVSASGVAPQPQTARQENNLQVLLLGDSFITTTGADASGAQYR